MCVWHDASTSCINTSRKQKVNFALRRSAGYSVERASEPVLPESRYDIKGVVTGKFQAHLSRIEFHHSLIVTCVEIFTGDQPIQCTVTDKIFRSRLSKLHQTVDPFLIVEREQLSVALVGNSSWKYVIACDIFDAFIYYQNLKHCVLHDTSNNHSYYTL